MKDKVVIAFATDHNFRYYTGVALFSLMEHASSDTQYEILILSESLSAADRALFFRLIEGKENFSLHFVDLKEKVKEIDITKLHLGGYGIAVLYRLFMHELLPEYDRILYLDSDIIVQADVKELFEADLKGAPIGVVKDFLTSFGTLRAWLFLDYCSKTLKLKNPKNYFNSGVLLLDTAQLRKSDFSQNLYSEFNCRIQFKFPDQDILNRIFEDKVCYLDQTWNYIIDKGHTAEGSKIVHYANLHPWFSNLLPKADLWWGTAEKTFFSEKMKKELINHPSRIKYLEYIEKAYYETRQSTCWRITAFMRFTADTIRVITYLLKNTLTKEK